MILGTLLEALFRRGVTLVATSNLRRPVFTAAGCSGSASCRRSRCIEENGRSMELDAGVDYRLRQLERATLFLGPSAGDAGRSCSQPNSSDCAGRGDHGGRSSSGRRPHRLRAREAEDVVWFEFRELCDGPRSTADYIEISRALPDRVRERRAALDATADE